MIPKNIFQTWCTKDLPPEIENIIDKMKKLNPDYKYHLYTDDEMDAFVKENYPGEIYDCYSKINFIVAKADFWRYLVLYKYGGVYLDMDSSIDVRLDDFIKNDESAILSLENGRETFTQWVLIFDLQHPILKRTIEFVVDNIKHNRYPLDILHMTGPFCFTRAVQSIHEEFFGSPLNIKTITYDTDIKYTWCSYSYRIFSNDYRPNFTFKHEHSHLLYNNKPHWSDLLKELVIILHK
jgi:mannosyltransferase OCH1-like enzyme